MSNPLMSGADIFNGNTHALSRRQDKMNCEWDRTNRSMYPKYEGDCLIDFTNNFYARAILSDRQLYPILIRGNDEV